MTRPDSIPTEHANIVVLEDDLPTSQLLCLALRKANFTPLPCFSVKEALQLIKEQQRISGMLIDLSLPDGDGIEVIRSGRKAHPGLPCFVLTAKDAVDSAVQAIKAGAENYLIKPYEPEKLMNSLAQAIMVYHTKKGGWGEELAPAHGIRRWKSRSMREAVEVAVQAGKAMSSVMLIGAASTGRSQFARLIHESSKLKGKPMTTINLAALSPLQIETELFGAPLEKLDESLPFSRGKLARCRGESLYIENIDRLHPAAQLHFLKIISGGESAKLPSCRLITSSSADFTTEIKEGRFRQDLWYALAVYKIQVPRLAERPEDLPQLCEGIITRICVTAKLRRPTLTRRALEMLVDHSWPGNLNELHSCLEHAITHTSDGLIGPDDFPLMNRQRGAEAPTGITLGAASIEELTRLTLTAALDACGGNRRRAAKRLKVSLRTIYNMIDRYGLPKKSKKRKDDPGAPAA